MGLGSLGALIGLGGSAASGLFSAIEAEKQRDWQQKMMETSYQRTMKDMRQAGLNPILAYKQGSVTSSPGGAMAQIPDLSRGMSGMLDSTAKQRKVTPEMALLNSQTNQAKAVALREIEQARLAGEQFRTEGFKQGQLHAAEEKLRTEEQILGADNAKNVHMRGVYEGKYGLEAALASEAGFGAVTGMAGKAAVGAVKTGTNAITKMRGFIKRSRDVRKHQRVAPGAYR